jgi:hypothetical protein
VLLLLVHALHAEEEQISEEQIVEVEEQKDEEAQAAGFMGMNPYDPSMSMGR